MPFYCICIPSSQPCFSLLQFLATKKHQCKKKMHSLAHNTTIIPKSILPPVSQHSPSPPPPPPPILRRDFAVSSILLPLLTMTIPSESLRAEPQVQPTMPDNCTSTESQQPTKKAFLDVSINGEPIGRIIIGLYGSTVPAGATRFSDLVGGSGGGITYRRKEFVKIMPNYLQHGGLRSYGVDAELARKTGRSLDAMDDLINEWERQNRDECRGMIKNVKESVSIIVRDPLKPPPKIKLVARKGKLEIDQEEVGSAPNGTEFVIVTEDSPELDGAALVVGRVVEGMDVVQRISQVKTVQENTSSPYFRVAKLIGDKRAVVAERGFNRPYAKVVITNCGLIG